MQSTREVIEKSYGHILLIYIHTNTINYTYEVARVIFNKADKRDDEENLFIYFMGGVFVRTVYQKFTPYFSLNTQK